MCAKKWGRGESRNLSRFIRGGGGITSIKEHLKGNQPNATVFNQKSSKPPTQVTNNDRSLVY